ncbi:hypothetical protein AB0D46_07475 [Streptomyces sp. NPDC048383]|uniref:hypothetical protein n=1 Tax=Streptomyces sp. NPDC048383 TaxID=3155386 RepID=UPI0034198E7C
METPTSLVIEQLANWLRGLTQRLDPGAGWYGEFLRRDPEGMRACLEGVAVPPWDVLDSLLADLADRAGAAGAGSVAREAEYAAGLRAAAVAAHDATPDGARELPALLAAAAEQRAVSQAAVRILTGRLGSAGADPARAAALARELSWTRDDAARAASRHTDLAARLDASGPRSQPTWPPPAPTSDESLPVLPSRREARTRPVAFPGAEPPPEAPDAPAEVPVGRAEGRWWRGGARRSGGARYAGAARAQPRPFTPPPGQEDPSAPAPGGALPAPRGARFGARNTAADAQHHRAAAAARVAGVAGAAGVAGVAGVAPPGSRTPHPADPGEPAPPAGSPGLRAPTPYADAGGPDAATVYADAGGPDAATVYADAGGPDAATGYADAGGPDAATGYADAGGPDAATAYADASGSPHPYAPAPGSPRPYADTPWPVAPSPGPGAPAAYAPDPGGPYAPAPGSPAAFPDHTPRPPDPSAASAGAAAGEDRVGGFVARLLDLRVRGLGGEAHALLCEAAGWPAALLPALAAGLGRAGLASDWATLLWEAASLPPARLAEVAAALGDAGRDTDCGRLLRQGVARPAAEVADAALALGAAGREREAHALLGAFVGLRTAEEAAALARRDPGWFVPRLLHEARALAGNRHRDLAHALRVAGLPGT